MIENSVHCTKKKSLIILFLVLIPVVAFFVILALDLHLMRNQDDIDGYICHEHNVHTSLVDYNECGLNDEEIQMNVLTEIFA